MRLEDYTKYNMAGETTWFHSHVKYRETQQGSDKDLTNLRRLTAKLVIG